MASNRIRPRVRRPGALLALSLFVVAGAAVGTTRAASAAVTPTPSAQVFAAPHLTPDVGTHWQGVASYSFTAGQTSQFLHEACPTNFPHVVNGAYAFNSAASNAVISVGFNAPRLDESPPSFGEWGWGFYFPGGAPAGLTVLLSIYCVK